MYTRPVKPAGTSAAAGLLAAVITVSAVFYGCEDPNAGSGGGPNKAVDRLQVIDHPYRVTYEPNLPDSREREKLLSYLGNDAARLPKYKGYREGEFLQDADLVSDTGQARLILHGLRVRVHYADGSSQTVTFPEDWQNNLMHGLGTDGHGMRFSWSSGMNWMVVRLDDKSIPFEIPFYKLDQVMIDLTETNANNPKKFYSMLDTDMEKSKLAVKGHYNQIGWYPIPDGVVIDTTYQSGLLGYLGPQDVRVRVYTGMSVDGASRDSILSSSSANILPPANSNYSAAYQVYVLPVFSLDPAAPEAEYTKLAPFDGGGFTHGGANSVIFNNSTNNDSNLGFEIGQHEVPYALWYAVGQWASWYKGYVFSNDDPDGKMNPSEQTIHINTVGTSQDLNNAAKFQTGSRGALSAPPPQGSPPGSDYFQPVTYITWKDAAVWCNAYTELLNVAANGSSAGWTNTWVSSGQTLSTLPKIFQGSGGLVHAYKNSGNSVITEFSGFDGDIKDRASAASDESGYRLPDETEWEFAARGGLYTTADWAASYGAGGDVLDTAGWYNGNSGGQTHPIGGKTGFTITPAAPPSVSYTLYDMIGNAAEWINVIADPVNSSTGTVNDLDNNSASRIARGGSYSKYANDCALNKDREAFDPQQVGSPSVGFRIARKNP
ncbi:MAG: formylglycine-generating enzyme family protein [Spirochaetaceae bacterium]|nr:formylglycine-generating enzyme family protein [Spirochaetaceae bacterium]